MTISLGEAHFFTLRTAAIFIHNGHVLLQNCDNSRAWFMPGGRVHAMEASPDALRREMWEESADKVVVGPLQWTVEVFYSKSDGQHHEIGLYYLASFVNAGRYDTARDFRGVEGTEGLTYRWFPIATIDQFPDIVPPFLYDALQAFPDGPRHIVDQSRRQGDQGTGQAMLSTTQPGR